MLLFQKNHGAISVFLILILVPCMLISSIFVDISRVQLSKAVAESSAELALNTLKTYYDYDLSSVYGLMGSCQNISEYYSTVSEYYDQALHSRDVEEEDLKLLYQRVYKEAAGRFSKEKISDILLVQNKTDGAVVSAISGANMHNSTILQQQIVEFMKYRAPIVIVSELIEMLKKEDSQGGVQASKESAANKPMLDAQEKYYEAESKLLEEANKSYWALRAYTEEIEKDGITATTLHDYGDKLAGYRDTYREINNWMVKNLWNTTELQTYKRPEVNLEGHLSEFTKENIGTPEPSAEPSESPSPDVSNTPAPTPEPETKYRVNDEKAKELTEELKKANNNFVTAVNDLVSAGSSLMSNKPGEGSSSYKIQWWVQMDKAIHKGSANDNKSHSAKVAEAGDNMAIAYAKVCAMLECTVDNDSLKTSATNEKERAEQLYADYINGTTEELQNAQKYIATVKELETVSDQNINQIKAENLHVNVNGSSATIPYALSTISTELNNMKSTAEKYVGYLNDIIEGNADKNIPSLETIGGLLGTYETKLNNWETSANNAKTPDGVSTEMSREHLETIGKIRDISLREEPAAAPGQEGETESEKIVREIKMEDLLALEQRLRNIKKQFESILDAIEAMKYGNIQVTNITNYSQFQGAASQNMNNTEIPLENNALNTLAQEKFNGLFSPSKENVVQLEGKVVNGALSHASYNPVVRYDMNNDKELTLYQKYYEAFGDKKPEEIKKQRKPLDDEADKGDKKAEEIQEKSRYNDPKGMNITDSDKKADNAFRFGEGLLGTLSSLIGSLVNMDITDIRDKLYVTEYIMNMFSYATFEHENYYDLVKGDEENGVQRLKELSLKDDKYLNVYKQYTGSAATSKTWLSENPVDGYNKTLTNEMINPSNNYAYQAEIEYILFGANNETSIKETYKVIYGIRYTLNLVSAFANFWGINKDTGKVINQAANIIAGATGFIIPAPLVKVILLPVLTVFETGKDMDRLEAGFPVELYKSADDWWISIEGTADQQNPLKVFSDALSGDRELQENAHGLRYSDYLTLFVYLGLNGRNSADGMYQRMADVIEKNMQLRTGKNDYSLNNTQVYFQIQSKLRVKPLMLTLPYFSGYLDDFIMGDDWCTFKVNTIRGY